MMTILTIIKIILGFAFFLAGVLFMYKPDFIKRTARILKETVLNESYLSLEGKKIGFFLALVGILLLYMGFSRIL